MHFLREGHFDIARTFLQETGSTQLDDARNEQISSDGDTVMLSESVTSLRNDTNASLPEYPETSMQKLEASFSDMYRILLALRDQGDLQPAIDWARANRDNLFLRGSDLEFELCRLRFVELYTGRRNPTSNSDHVMADDEDAGRRQRAFEYARTTFNDLSVRYLRETSVLMTSLIYASSLETSPYSSLFFDEHAWLKISNSFVREFCGLLGLSEKSPLYTAVTAGGIALPVLEKLERKMGNIGGQWTSANELPVSPLLLLAYLKSLISVQVEIPVPPTLQFHSIFVCPVSKEQATDSNPPMMMPCYHVIAKESLEQISRGSKSVLNRRYGIVSPRDVLTFSHRRFKCPYCPNESNPLEAKIVFL